MPQKYKQFGLSLVLRGFYWDKMRSSEIVQSFSVNSVSCSAGKKEDSQGDWKKLIWK